ncbi:MAG TPA: DUF3320 domain-containing protein [Lysobacter sp.]
MERLEEEAGKAPESGSILREAGPLVGKVNRARLELLDLSTRNRLLNTPRSGRAKTVEVINELAKVMYQTLVIDGKRFTFVAGRAEPTQVDDELAGLSIEVALDGEALSEIHEAPEDPQLLAQPDLELDEHGRVVSHWDAHLTTRFTPTGLQKRLLDLYIDARTLQEEQGINVLYLAIGYLKWRAPGAPKVDRYAPLVLVPVALERSNAGEKFHLRWQGDEIQANLSLQLFLQRQFDLKLPDIDDFESLDIDAYLASVAKLIGDTPDWEVVHNDAVLGLFSFAKFMMYRDLDPALWTAHGGMESIPMLRGVVSDGFPGASLSGENFDIDKEITPNRMRHVVDSDSSQSLVVYDALNGHSMVVQGPPGTGKSQTIANVIAGAVASGKRVLFVAEKLAALEVVKRRLDQVRIGSACLELHSNKANKRTLLEDLRLTWQLAKLPPEPNETIVEQLAERQADLNAHAERLHRILLPAEMTPYAVFGELVRLRREGFTTEHLPLSEPLKWAPHEVDARRKLLADICDRIRSIGVPAHHTWSGVDNDVLLPNDVERLGKETGALKRRLESWREAAMRLHDELALSLPDQLSACTQAVTRCDLLLTAPPLDATAFRSTAWDDIASVEEALQALILAQTLRDDTQSLVADDARDLDWSGAKATLEDLLPSFTVGSELQILAAAYRDLTSIAPDLTRLRQLLSERAGPTFASASRLVAIGERAGTIPELDRDALVARIWERGVDTVEGVVESVERVQSARKQVAGVFRDSAWLKDLETAREELASRSGSWLRFLSGQWRNANRSVRAQLTNPKLPTDQMLAALDQLLDGQAAFQRVQQSDAQGIEAFGSSWERDRSNPAYMRGVVAWMRTLRPLGTGVREQLADVSDRRLAVELASRIRPTLEHAQKSLTSVHEALLAGGKKLWGDETSLVALPLSDIAKRIAPFAAAFDDVQHVVDCDQLTVSQVAERIGLLEQDQAARKQLGEKAPLGRSAFGPLWLDIGSDAVALGSAVSWLHQNGDLRDLAAAIRDPVAKRMQALDLLARGEVLAGELMGLFTTLAFSGTRLLSADPIKASVAEAIKQLDAWELDPEGLPQWVGYLAQAKRAQRQGLGAIVNELHQGDLEPDRTRGTFDLAYMESLLAAMITRDRELGQFDGKRQTALVESFTTLDRDRIDLARRQVSQVHRANIPQRGGAAGPTAALMGEMAKKRAHWPIRVLMERAAPAIQALKPVFMMSPLSVAQFLPPGKIGFDLLVVDEASQVQPIDALGAIARAKQIVVVGDERQLPPTRFFSKTLGDGHDGADDDGAQAADVESILGLCRARGLPERMLRWHYRSRHQSLIAVSNQQFYENKLVIVPSPYTGEAGVGLRFHHLPDAVYDRGNTRTNPKEAKAIAQAVISHALTTPNLTLGVAAFSTQQRRAVFDEIELLRRQHPETEGFFGAHAHEPFFVKSLENIQGDERDVILISIGYGRDSHGNVSMNFGPVSNEGGERRLNVLISRAKSRCEVFSSITDDDIDLERGRGKGTAALKLFMHYARTGRMQIDKSAEEHKDGVFEQEVAAALRSRGYDFHTNVGEAGIFVDIAIYDPAKPGRYILGIECDGDSYRAAKSARDRDRLREQALRDKGWNIHRIWSSEWFRRPKAQLDELVAIIEAAKVEPDPLATDHAPRSRAVPVDIESVEHEDYVEVGLVAFEAPPTQAYVEASFSVPKHQYELHLVPPARMATIVRDVVHVEGPIHCSEVAVRIRSLWDLQRTGGRIQAAVEDGIEHAVRERLVEREGDFLLWPGREAIPRDRSGAESNTLRRPELLPPMEIDVAILSLVKENLGATLDEVALHVSRRLGYRTTSAQLRAALIARTEALVSKGRLELRSGSLSVAS